MNSDALRPNLASRHFGAMARNTLHIFTPAGFCFCELCWSLGMAEVLVGTLGSSSVSSSWPSLEHKPTTYDSYDSYDFSQWNVQVQSTLERWLQCIETDYRQQTCYKCEAPASGGQTTSNKGPKMNLSFVPEVSSFHTNIRDGDFVGNLCILRRQRRVKNREEGLVWRPYEFAMVSVYKVASTQPCKSSFKSQAA